MPLESHMESKQNEDGTTMETLVVEFSNGSLQQLRDLAKFFKIEGDDPYKAIEFAIGFLETIKERGSNNPQN